jgi:GcrA cell cycle regulator
MQDAWTAERIDLLRRLWAEGETAQAIAGALGGLSRAAVLGKISRLRRAAIVAAASAEPPSAAATILSPVRRRQRAKTIEPPPPPSALHTLHKGLLELTNTSCRSEN